MTLIKVERYFKTIKHPLGDGLYLKIGMEFNNKEDAEKFKVAKINWDEGVEVVEISQEEYLKETEDE